jgi:hypothetical protein
MAAGETKIGTESLWPKKVVLVSQREKSTKIRDRSRMER